MALVAILTPCVVHAQTNLSSTINAYQPAVAITPNGCFTDVEVASAAPYAVGDSVLIIQMKGAVIDTTNTAAFGSIIALNGAGNNEIKRIASITGNTLTLAGPLANTYDVNGRVQVITFPTYASANVVAALPVPPWNGSTGGVLAFRVWGTLTINADIDADGKGFRGGLITNNPDGGCGGGSPDFHYDLYQGGITWVSGGAEKGEGIATVSSAKGAGKGCLANGGGGGNKHNFGGAGGGNFTRGGQGGGPLQGCPNLGNGGVGGISLASAINAGALFLGGGGGRGDDNNGVGQPGMPGGGIILILAGQLVGNGHTIRANGYSQFIPGSGIADGTGGGGAGGTILISAGSITGALSLIANGGDGGDQAATYGCVGTGGGGGTGAVISCNGAFPASVTVQTDPGLAGTFTTPGYPCTGSTYGAADGDANTTGPVIRTGCFPPPPPQVDLDDDVITDTTVCLGDTLFLDTATTGATYLWQNGSTAPYHVVTGGGTVWVQTTLGCDAVADTATVTIAGTPAFDYLSDTTLCLGDTLFISPVLPGAAYVWSDGSTQLYQVVNASGTYSVAVSLVCDTVFDSAVITFTPPPSADLGPDTTACPGEPVLLAVPAGNASVLWDDGSTGDLLPATAPSDHAVVATNACGETAQDSIRIAAADCSCYFHVPNSFTPDGDGINDLFLPAVDCELRDYHLMIFDRWGERIFDSYAPGIPWDGTVNGTRAQIGVYVYKVSYRPLRAVGPVEVVGHVSLIR